MYIYQQVRFSEFYNRFQAIRPDNFSYDGLCALYEYYTNLAEETGEPIELDVIAICCDWSEESREELCRNYSQEWEELDQYLVDNTYSVLLENDRILYQQF